MSIAAQLDSDKALARKQQGGAPAISGSAQGIKNNIKKIQFFLDIVKAVSFMVSLFTGGLDGFSLGTFLVVGNGELLADKFTSVYKIPQWKKMVIIWCDAIAVVLAGVIALIMLLFWCNIEIWECSKVLIEGLF